MRQVRTPLVGASTVNVVAIGVSFLAHLRSGLRQAAGGRRILAPGTTPETVQAGHSGTVERDVSAALSGALMARTDQQFVSVPGRESYVV